MQLQDKSGIICDRCGKSYHTTFTYYSFDFRELLFKDGYLQQLDPHSKPVLSIDICSSCIDAIKKLVIKNYKPSKKIRNRYTAGICCDMTGLIIKPTGTQSIYHCMITKADVDIPSISHNR